MKALNKKLLTISMIASLLLVGCASTDPYTPQSNDDFVYDPDASFAMNVVEGSLGLHNGLRDADRPESSDVSASGLDYAADGIIGAAFGGGIGGALLSILGTNEGNKPLNTYYGIVYYPITQKGNIQQVFDQIETELIHKAESTRELTYIEKVQKDNGTVSLKFKGDGCSIHQTLMGYKKEDTCSFIHYDSAKLLKYSTITPSGDKGMYAVIGYEGFFTATYLSLDLDDKFYTFSPVIRGRTKFPFVSNNSKIYPFIKGDGSLTIPELMKLDSWVNKHYGAVQ